MILYSLCVLVMKWIVIGRYRPREVKVNTGSYLCWWFVDCGVYLWEVLVGTFILDTKMSWMFYTLGGAKVDVSTELQAFIREFDLCTVGSDACIIKHGVRCRMFDSPVKEEEEAVDEVRSSLVTFRPIRMGKGCMIDGMVCPGASVGDYSHVTKTSVVVAGAQIPANTIASGNPAKNYGATKRRAVNETDSLWLWLLMEVGKIVWVVVDGGIWWYLWLASLQFTAYFGPLMQSCSAIVLTPALGVIVSIGLKWVLIGCRAAGQEDMSSRGVRLVTHRIAYWCCDYHFQLCTTVLLCVVSSSSKLWNVVLWLHGLDTDMATCLDPRSFPPSKVDLVKVRNSDISSSSSFSLCLEELERGSKGKWEIINKRFVGRKGGEGEEGVLGSGRNRRYRSWIRTTSI